MRKSLVLLASLVTTTVALAADNYGDSGAITEMHTNYTSADTYLQYHGRIVITSGNEVVGYSTQEYRWGGTSCGSKTLSDAVVDRLQRAQLAAMTVTPLWKDGQGSTRCLVGFVEE